MEIVRTILSILTPLLVLLVGIPIARRTKRLDTEAWVDQKIIERRLTLYDEVGPRLNDLYCLSAFKGHFRTIDPPQALNHKRSLDRVMHVNRPIFSRNLLDAYHAFMKTIFETYVGSAKTRYSLTISLNLAWLQSTRSILLTASTMCRMPSRLTR